MYILNKMARLYYRLKAKINGVPFEFKDLWRPWLCKQSRFLVDITPDIRMDVESLQNAKLNDTVMLIYAYGRLHWYKCTKVKKLDDALQDPYELTFEYRGS